MLRRCGVVGHPVQHSLSPAMHRAAYAALGLDWTYDAVDVAPGGLAEHVASLDESWRALSVTAPHKRDALALADVPDDVALAVGGANTLLLGERVAAHNTDVAGVVAALQERGVDAPRSVRIVGGGATATSVAAAVARMGAASVELVVRDEARAAQAAEVATTAGLAVTVSDLADVAQHGGVDLLVSTVPTEAVAQHAERLVGAASAVFDVVYDPWPTPLAEATVAASRPLVNGLDLLAHQAIAQVELMCGVVLRPGPGTPGGVVVRPGPGTPAGVDVGVDLLRDAAVAELARRSPTA
ncbi:shikimate dehydrogenase [Aeromicrobium sp. CTD01-1L150]|uniref:shikimate dehydrogenase n=1 Tax=Aeromicrobium sp. CTD01-1L150 TaxID=3341830 RepID=UPI0035C03AA5